MNIVAMEERTRDERHNRRQEWSSCLSLGSRSARCLAAVNVNVRILTTCFHALNSTRSARTMCNF